MRYGGDVYQQDGWMLTPFFAARITAWRVPEKYLSIWSPEKNAGLRAQVDDWLASVAAKSGRPCAIEGKTPKPHSKLEWHRIPSWDNKRCIYGINATVLAMFDRDLKASRYRTVWLGKDRSRAIAALRDREVVGFLMPMVALREGSLVAS